MKRILTLLAFLFCGAAHAQDALVVATCGTLPLAYAPGATRLLTVDTTGKLCGTGGGGAGNPGGSNTQLQYNNGGSFGGITGATTNGTTLTLVASVLGTPASMTATNVTGTAAGLTAGSVTGGAIQPLSGTSSTVGGMSAGAAMSDTDLLYCAQSGGTTDRKCTGAQAKTYINTSAVRATTTTSEPLANSDQNKLVTFSNAAPVACTIAQAGAGGNFASGWAVSLKNLGAGTVTCTPTTSTIDGVATVTLTTGQGLDLYSDGTNYTTQAGKGLVSLNVAGTSALGTSAIGSAACASAVTTAATGTATTDVIWWGFNGDPTAVTGYVPLTTGMLTIIAYPTANNVNFKVCNNTSASITPGAITLNWRVVR